MRMSTANQRVQMDNRGAGLCGVRKETIRGKKPMGCDRSAVHRPNNATGRGKNDKSKEWV